MTIIIAAAFSIAYLLGLPPCLTISDAGVFLVTSLLALIAVVTTADSTLG